MEKRDEGTGGDRIDDAEDAMERAEEQEDPVRLEAISQLHDILELELDRPEDEVPADDAAPEPEES